MSAVAATLGVARTNLAVRLSPAVPKRRGRPPQPDDGLLARIKAVIADMPTYGYRRVHAILRRAAEQDGGALLNHKRVWRVMKQHGLLLQRYAGGDERRHDGRIAVAERNRRWCSDGFEVGCHNGERVRVAFALDCCDREAMSFIATTGGIAGEHVKDLMVAALEHRFGPVDTLPRRHRVAQRQWQLLHRARHAALCPWHRSGAKDHAVRKPAEQRYGRGVRPHVQARLRQARL